MRAADWGYLAWLVWLALGAAAIYWLNVQVVARSINALPF